MAIGHQVELPVGGLSWRARAEGLGCFLVTGSNSPSLPATVDYLANVLEVDPLLSALGRSLHASTAFLWHLGPLQNLSTLMSWFSLFGPPFFLFQTFRLLNQLLHLSGLQIRRFIFSKAFNVSICHLPLLPSACSSLFYFST